MTVNVPSYIKLKEKRKLSEYFSKKEFDVKLFLFLLSIRKLLFSIYVHRV